MLFIIILYLLCATHCVVDGEQSMSKEVANTYNYIDAYLDDVRSRGRFAFTLEELKDIFVNNSDKAILQSFPIRFLLKNLFLLYCF